MPDSMHFTKLQEIILGTIILARGEFNSDMSDEALTAIILTDLGYIF